MIDKLFKLAVVVLAAGFLWVYYINTQNGRYQPVSGGSAAVLDGREGITYLNPPTRELPSSNK